MFLLADMDLFMGSETFLVGLNVEHVGCAPLFLQFHHLCLCPTALTCWNFLVCIESFSLISPE